ncbi:MAG TPA: hypothetical protein VHA52_01465, partial [Candidatus Babeliaceae bacterium]|nr:hypothetical protein [Candidatus Babeliaceae bacterium]
ENKLSWLRIWIGALLMTAVVGISDFWRWEYSYGHHLDPHAAIKIPGMSYQPPLLGYKQLLNFTAGSFPAIGGYMIILPAVLLVTISLFEEYNRKTVSYVPAS